MNRILDRILNRKIMIKNIRLTVLDLLFLVCLLGFSLAARIALFPQVSGDYAGFLGPWMEQIRELGGIPSLGHEISNYSAAYMIIMSLLSYIDADPMHLLKSVSVLFDYVAAGAVFLTVAAITGNAKKAIWAMGGLLLAPTVMLNGAGWSQCDMIYVAFLLWGIYFLYRGNSQRALWLTAVGFAFKLQALFILPFYVIFWLCPRMVADDERRTVRLREFLPLPLPYLFFALPGILLGRDIWSAIGVYLRQTEYYPWLSLNYPNIYAFFGQTYLSETQIAELGRGGIFATILILGFLAFYLYGRKIKINGELMITVALLSVGVVLYGLPYMHERYGMLVDALAVIYAVLRPGRIPVAVGLIFSSLISYMPFLFGKEGLAPLHHALLQLVLLIAVALDFKNQCDCAGRLRGGKSPGSEAKLP